MPPGTQAAFQIPGGHIPSSAGAAQALLDAIRRMGQRVQGTQSLHGRLAMVVHLSQLRPPAPRPHHRRVARAMLHDTALRHDGQMFAVDNGDLVLLCRLDAATAPGRSGTSQDPLTLSRTLGRLLRADAIDPDRLISLWNLQDGAGPLLDYTAARLRDVGAATLPARRLAEEDAQAQPDQLDALAALIDSTPAADLLQRQTAMLLSHTRTTALRPIFRELTFSLADLEARVAAPGGAWSSVASDPYLSRHLATRLDRRLIALLHRQGGAEPGFAPPDGEPLHVNLSVAGILSDGFARLAASHARPPLGIEVAAMDACADPAAFAHARRRLADAGMKLVLDGLSHLALMLSRPWSLAPDLVKLDWTAAIAALSASDAMRLDAALHRVGPDRLVLQHADTEAAMQWGMSRGIRRFQGRHADAMLAAARMASCQLAAGCTLRQCMERGLATGGAGRRSCGNPALLDATLAAPAWAAPARAAAA